MIHLLLDVDTATDLLALVQRAGFVDVVGPLRRELHMESLLPWPDPPSLSVTRYGESCRDIFDDVMADVMYAAMQAAYDQAVRSRQHKPPIAVAADTGHSLRARRSSGVTR